MTRCKATKEHQRVDPIAVVLVLVSVSCIALSAYFAKLLLSDLPSGQVLLLRFSGYVAVMAIPTWFLCRSELFRPYRPDQQIIRGLVAVGVAYAFILALERMGLTEAMAAFYVYPAIAYVLGIAFLSEQSELAKWVATVVGFVGVLFVLQPGVGMANLGAAFAFTAALLVGIRMALYRSHRGKVSPLVAAFWERCVGMVVLLVVIPFEWSPLTAAMTSPILGLVLSSIVAQVTLVYALTRAPLGVLAPFVYWEVIVALLIDVTLLSSATSVLEVVGVFLIALAGVAMSISSIRNALTSLSRP